MPKNVPIGNFRTKLDAEVAGGVLANQNIPFLIQSTEGMLHGPIAPGATIFVAPDVADRAKQLLEDTGLIDDDDGDDPS